MTADLYPAPLPEIPCCMAAVTTYGASCTCWSVEVDRAQAPPQEGPALLRRTCCEDCAYRRDSVERQRGDDPDYGVREPFYCHAGMPAVVRRYHPDGAVVDGDPGDYQPYMRDERIWKADGSPAELCAGWGAINMLRRPRRSHP